MTLRPLEKISSKYARGLWLQAQKLDQPAPFGAGPEAVKAAVEHLGYVQIDTINVIERCHHHILFSRIPRYHRRDLLQAQSLDKSVFEYWTHALSYVPTRDLRYFLPAMKAHEKDPGTWFQSVKKADANRLYRQIKNDGALSIRDIEDEVLVEKSHPWASRKPSKKVLQLGFYSGRLTISERIGMLKKYELIDRHFCWEKRPKAATQAEVLAYRLDRALRAQELVSLDSICHLRPNTKPATLAILDKRVKRGELIEVSLGASAGQHHWMRPEGLSMRPEINDERVHILSPFDPLIIQRKRLQSFFDYEHRFEAYIPKEKRVFGYFALPVLIGDRIVAVLDLKTDREKSELLIQQWTWLGKEKSKANKELIEAELGRFEKFQLSK